MKETNMDCSDQFAVLVKEFNSSGLGIDEFVERKLVESGRGSRSEARRLVEAFARIDANYAELQRAKSEGRNRQEWLRGKIESDISNLKADGKRNEIGRILAVGAAKTAGLNVAETTAAFDGIDAVDIIADIDEKLTERVCASLDQIEEVSK